MHGLLVTVLGENMSILKSSKALKSQRKLCATSLLFYLYLPPVELRDHGGVQPMLLHRWLFCREIAFLQIGYLSDFGLQNSTSPALCFGYVYDAINLHRDTVCQKRMHEVSIRPV